MRRIFFDLDDTLYKSDELRMRRENAIQKFLEEEGKIGEYLFLKKQYNTIRSFEMLGISREKFYEILESVEINIPSDMRIKKILKNLSQKYHLIILSNSSEKLVHEILVQLEIKEFFIKILCGDKISHPKPHPEAFIEVRKDDIFVGNSFNKDLKIPKERGAITILVSESHHPGADFNIKKIYEISEVINQIESEFFVC